ncbi:amidohydrolase family protein [Sphingomicrobium clamense]|uniref:Amidohydrolase family protein n=1 Tax=Sphingomicrobium clamense TaxID=2851013 RepID=A0ABS6V3L0_9SPHN|nr:amidohydrolase family protein [Sphingomicrobium sp. B8]MBW0144129.1 amidohydrolase family protein [Sphingomicrobium sp. B8]
MMALAMAGAPVEGDVLISDVTVIDPASETVTAGRDILIDEGRIVAIAPHGEGDLEAARVIDAAGHFVIPGLNDMHSHASFAPIHLSSLKLMHANGVTGVREMGSDCKDEGSIGMCLDAMRVSREQIANGELVGPKLLELSSAKIGMRRAPTKDPVELFYEPSSAEEARASVTFMRSRGAEILKISQEWTPEGFTAFMDAANEADVRVGGHIPMWTSTADAARMGVTSIEHARDLPMDCAAVGAEMRDQLKRKLSGEDLPWPDRRSIPGRAVAEHDAALCEEQVRAMAESGTYYVPTHLTREMDYRAVEDEYRNDPRMAYVPAMQQRHWNRDLDRTAQAPPELIEDLEDFYHLGLRTTKIAHDAGVKVLVGTDANDTMVFPGFSVHDEIANLVEAGLTPMQALAAATTVPADYFGRDDMGGVSEGMVADLVLLSASPIDDIANTTSIEAVIQDGRVSDRATLDALLDEVKAFAAGSGTDE